jgi:hypothetical protein
MTKPPLRPAVAYRVSDLAELLDFDERTVVAWLGRHGVSVETIGTKRGRVVWLADLLQAFPQLERSLEALKDFHGGA